MVRVVDSLNEESKRICPNCKRILAFTKDDIQSLTHGSFAFDPYVRLESYIKCPICKYEITLDTKFINLEGGNQD